MAITLLNVAAGAHPERATIVTIRGETYVDARILHVGLDDIIIRHDGGVENLRYNALSPETRALFDFDPEAAEAERASRREAEEARRRQQEEARQAQPATTEADRPAEDTPRDGESARSTVAACAPAWEDGPTNVNHNATIGRRPERLPATGTLQAVFLFVDFPDAPGPGSRRAYRDLMLPRGPDMLHDFSYGQLTIDVTVIDTWIRMPRRSTQYNFERGISFQDHRDYLRDAVTAAGDRVDISEFDIVYVMPTRNADAITFSPAFSPISRDYGIEVDGGIVMNAVTFGQDAWLDGWGHNVFVHETGHLLDLPDLYAYEGATHRFVGEWDIMGQFGRGPELLAWNRWKLGWIGDDQVRCLSQPGTGTVRLSPVTRPDGVKLAVIKLDDERYLAIESRRSEGHDRNIPLFGGVLIYLVDISVPTGEGPIQLLRNPNTAMGLLLRGQEFEDPSGRATIRLLESNSDGDTVALRLR